MTADKELKRICENVLTEFLLGSCMDFREKVMPIILLGALLGVTWEYRFGLLPGELSQNGRDFRRKFSRGLIRRSGYVDERIARSTTALTKLSSSGSRENHLR